MTIVRLLIALSLLSSGSLGCGGILDEIDGAHEEMGINEEKKVNKAKVAKRSKKSRKAAAIAKAKEWWHQVESLSPIQLDESISRCDVNGHVTFMTRDDCESRGGRMAAN
jgi:hypothetical protein